MSERDENKNEKMKWVKREVERLEGGSEKEQRRESKEGIEVRRIEAERG